MQNSHQSPSLSSQKTTTIHKKRKQQPRKQPKTSPYFDKKKKKKKDYCKTVSSYSMTNAQSRYFMDSPTSSFGSLRRLGPWMLLQMSGNPTTKSLLSPRTKETNNDSTSSSSRNANNRLFLRMSCSCCCSLCMPLVIDVVNQYDGCEVFQKKLKELLVQQQQQHHQGRRNSCVCSSSSSFVVAPSSSSLRSSATFSSSSSPEASLTFSASASCESKKCDNKCYSYSKQQTDEKGKEILPPCWERIGNLIEEAVRHLCSRCCYLHAYMPFREWHTLQQFVHEIYDGPIETILSGWNCVLEKPMNKTPLQNDEGEQQEQKKVSTRRLDSYGGPSMGNSTIQHVAMDDTDEDTTTCRSLGGFRRKVVFVSPDGKYCMNKTQVMKKNHSLYRLTTQKTMSSVCKYPNQQDQQEKQERQEQKQQMQLGQKNQKLNSCSCSSKKRDFSCDHHSIACATTTAISTTSESHGYNYQPQKRHRLHYHQQHHRHEVPSQGTMKNEGKGSNKQHNDYNSEDDDHNSHDDSHHHRHCHRSKLEQDQQPIHELIARCSSNNGGRDGTTVTNNGSYLISKKDNSSCHSSCNIHDEDIHDNELNSHTKNSRKHKDDDDDNNNNDDDDDDDDDNNSIKRSKNCHKKSNVAEMKAKVTRVQVPSEKIVVTSQKTESVAENNSNGPMASGMMSTTNSPLGLLEELFCNDPWRLLLSTILLNRTARVQVDIVLYRFLQFWPSAKAVVRYGTIEKISEVIAPLGLRHKRAKGILQFSQDYLDLVEKHVQRLRHKNGCNRSSTHCNKHHKQIIANSLATAMKTTATTTTTTMTTTETTIMNDRCEKASFVAKLTVENGEKEHGQENDNEGTDVAFHFSRDDVLSLYQCGEYAYDAYNLFILRRWNGADPSDRVLRSYVEYQRGFHRYNRVQKVVVDDDNRIYSKGMELNGTKHNENMDIHTTTNNMV